MVAYAWDRGLRSPAGVRCYNEVRTCLYHGQILSRSAKRKSVKKVFISPLANIYRKLTKYFA